MSEYLPGDRVVLTNQVSPVLRGCLATVVDFKPKSSDNRSVFVKLDDDPQPESITSGFRGWYANDVEHFLQRQPIQPGAWVRTISGKDTFQIRQVYSTVKGDDYAITMAGGQFNVENLARIAEPALIGHGWYMAREPATDMSRTNIGAALDRRNQQIAEYQRQLRELGDFIRNDLGEKPAGAELVTGSAIRIMNRQREAITEAAKIMCKRNGDGIADTWLAAYAPEPKPAFKRGDLVSHALSGFHRARIVTIDRNSLQTVYELMDTISGETRWETSGIQRLID